MKSRAPTCQPLQCNRSISAFSFALASERKRWCCVLICISFCGRLSIFSYGYQLFQCCYFLVISVCYNQDARLYSSEKRKGKKKTLATLSSVKYNSLRTQKFEGHVKGESFCIGQWHSRTGDIQCYSCGSPRQTLVRCHYVEWFAQGTKQDHGSLVLGLPNHWPPAQASLSLRHLSCKYQVWVIAVSVSPN